MLRAPRLTMVAQRAGVQPAAAAARGQRHHRQDFD
jgi:hypothetical protein